MSIKSLFGSIFGRSGDPEPVSERKQDTETPTAYPFPVFNSGMPIEILEDFKTTLLCGRLDKSYDAGSAPELAVERIPGEMSFPIVELGKSVLVRGYDEEMNPIVLQGRIGKSSLVKCVVEDLSEYSLRHLRENVRYPLRPAATIYALEDTRLNNPHPCKLVNISVGGACILSEHVYEVEDKLRLRVELIKGEGHTSYHCQVVRAVPQEDGSVEYGLLFEQLTEKKIRELMRDIETVQRETKKRVLS